jgi:hypothetical protein
MRAISRSSKTIPIGFARISIFRCSPAARRFFPQWDGNTAKTPIWQWLPRSRRLCREWLCRRISSPGFPGESEEDFKETVAFAKAIGYMRIHAFPYSERPLTRASLIKDGKVPMAVRKERTQELIRLSAELDKAYRKEHAGMKARLLVEAAIPSGGLFGLYRELPGNDLDLFP